MYINNKTKILIIGIWVIVSGAILIAAGFFFGVSFQRQKISPQVAELQRIKTSFEKLSSSKIISSIVAFGEVIDINSAERKIILSYKGENLPVLIGKDAEISFFDISFLKQGTSLTSPLQRKGSFKNIKIGDNLNISLKILSDGQLEGVAVIIFPATETP